MAFITIEDESSSIDVTVFPHTLRQNEMYMVEGKAVLATVKVNERTGEGRGLILNEMVPIKKKTIDDILSKESEKKPSSFPQCPFVIPQEFIGQEASLRLYIQIPTMRDQRVIQRIRRILKMAKGDMQVAIYSRDDKRTIIPADLNCALDISLISHLKKAFGDENVVIVRPSKPLKAPRLIPFSQDGKNCG